MTLVDARVFGQYQTTSASQEHSSRPSMQLLAVEEQGTEGVASMNLWGT